MRVGSTNRIFVFDRALVFCGRAPDAELHAHHALQIGLGLDGPLRARGLGKARPLHCRAVRIAPNAPHSLQTGAQRLALVYLDPHHPSSRLLCPPDAPAIAALPPPSRTTLEALWQARSPPEAEATLRNLLGAGHHFSTVSTPADLDPRVRYALDILDTNCPEHVAVAELAKRVGLSPSRLGHLFSEQVGITIPRFGLWLRMKRAANVVQEGRSLTDLAHRSGFADSAHFSRTFRAMFGMPPRDILRHSDFVQASAQRQR